ncbi:hypothetical protein WICPIJ_005708 [Wickerhamomyces pijperi]|uniref:Uncharacterized protein n=1 Tax=Wickerhamomyces pijperi TaxID=599730 RepID=A0A9P8Q325_WICPI|nr:hypothetical protein WICPIJ_005708 [Wickerhamomyces pijperi]
MTTSEEELKSLKAQIQALEKEVHSLKQTSIFSDIQPYIPEHATKYKHIKINPIGLTYLINFKKSKILTSLRDRIAEDLHQDDPENIQLINPITGLLINLQNEKDIKFKDFEDDDGVINLDFQYRQLLNKSSCCDHHHDHEEDDDSQDEFTDDENFYSQCSCSHPH